MCLEQKICNLCHPQTPVRLLPPRQSQGAYTQLENHTVRVPDAKSDCSRRGEAEVRLLKSDCCRARRSRATYTES